MRKTFTLALIASATFATAAIAADSYVVVPKSSQQLKPAANGLTIGQTLIDHKNSQSNITIREKSGLAEVHAAWEDHIFILDGEVTMILGGTAENAKTTGPGETRGDSIKGGKSFSLHAGDYIYIPVNTPHQMLVAAGKSIKYGVVKTHP
jgi:quercetin dioxygenase-like cupin family protein